jgi:hypothetical protein
MAWPLCGFAIVVVVGAVNVIGAGGPGVERFTPPPHPARARPATAVMIKAFGFISPLYTSQTA